jgi:hypothetical protein
VTQEIIRLNLVSPLYYIRDEKADPFARREESEEMLFCFEIDPAQGLSIEPDESRLLTALIFGGRAADPGTPAADPGEVPGAFAGAALQLPAGNYLFSQEREMLSRDEIAGMAAEVQKEGLWQRLRPGKELYLRYLFEDGKGVTQIFRPYTL